MDDVLQLLVICAAWLALASAAQPELSIDGERIAPNRFCTVDELLPRTTSTANNAISSEWSERNTTIDPYGCDCSYTRARYFCPSRQPNQGYPQWEPRAVSEGVCNSITRAQLSEAPLPPGFKVLIYGNSHLRQVVEALMCIFPDKVEGKSGTFPQVSTEERRSLSGNATCRYSKDPDWATLAEHHCLKEEDLGGTGKDCSDDIGEFFMNNGAEVHYYFSGGDAKKSVKDALRFHNPYWFHYDAVFANSGNPPFMSEESALVSARQLQQAAVPFFWLSEYDGVGDINGWEASAVARFHELGAKFVDIRSMTHGMRAFTKGSVESVPKDQGGRFDVAADDAFKKVKGDPHFCLPGPPNEMALLLLKLMWAVRQEST